MGTSAGARIAGSKSASDVFRNHPRKNEPLGERRFGQGGEPMIFKFFAPGLNPLAVEVEAETLQNALDLWTKESFHERFESYSDLVAFAGMTGPQMGAIMQRFDVRNEKLILVHTFALDLMKFDDDDDDGEDDE
jgi:hypothetical protein